jgi:hypothetical protein
MDIKEMLSHTFSAPKMPEAKPAFIMPPIPPKPSRSVGDVFLALQGQRIYDPNIPMVEKPKPPTSTNIGTGTAPAMDTTKPWGNPQMENKL